MTSVASPVAPRVPWVFFSVDDRRFALPLPTVARVVRAAWITALPGAPVVVAGVIDVGGRATPVFSVRRRVGIPDRPLRATDQFILAHTARRDVALIADAVSGVRDTPADATGRRDSLGDAAAHVAGALLLEDGLVLIEDLEQWLSADEEAALDAALRDEATDAR